MVRFAGFGLVRTNLNPSGSVRIHVTSYPITRRMEHSASSTFREVFRKVFGRLRHEKISEMRVFVVAIDFVKFSSKSELSSRFFGCLKFSAVLKFSAGWLTEQRGPRRPNVLRYPGINEQTQKTNKRVWFNFAPKFMNRVFKLSERSLD